MNKCKLDELKLWSFSPDHAFHSAWFATSSQVTCSMDIFPNIYLFIVSLFPLRVHLWKSVFVCFLASKISPSCAADIATLEPRNRRVRRTFFFFFFCLYLHFFFFTGAVVETECNCLNLRSVPNTGGSRCENGGECNNLMTTFYFDTAIDWKSKLKLMNGLNTKTYGFTTVLSKFIALLTTDYLVLCGRSRRALHQ